jgi:hypothetical protein
MAKEDAEKVLKHLENAKEAASPLKDKGLTRQIEQVSEQVKKRIDPDKSSTEKKKE